MSNRYLHLMIGVLYFGFALFCASVQLWANGWPAQVIAREFQNLYIADMLGLLYALYGLLFRS